MNLFLSLFLCNTITDACFSSLGKVPSTRQRLIICVKGCTKCPEKFLSKFVGILCGPDDLPIFKERIVVRTSSSVTTAKRKLLFDGLLR